MERRLLRMQTYKIKRDSELFAHPDFMNRPLYIEGELLLMARGDGMFSTNYACSVFAVEPSVHNNYCKYFVGLTDIFDPYKNSDLDEPTPPERRTRTVFLHDFDAVRSYLLACSDSAFDFVMYWELGVIDAVMHDRSSALVKIYAHKPYLPSWYTNFVFYMTSVTLLSCYFLF